METDRELLERYMSGGSDAAFAEIVERYFGLVFGAAMRQVKDRHTAEDVLQAVFIVLARKAREAGKGGALAGWLLQTTRYCAADAIKMNRRRGFHEREAAAMKTEVESSSTGVDLREFLDEALERLNLRDRSAVAMHYLQQQPVGVVAEALGLTEGAGRKCIERAVVRLRKALAITSGRALESGAMSGVLVAAGGVGGGATISSSVVASVALHAGNQIALNSGPVIIAKGVMHTMTVVKLQVAAAVMVAVVAASAGTYGILRPALAKDAPAAAGAAPVAAPAAGVVGEHILADGKLGISVVAVGPWLANQEHEWWNPDGSKSSFVPPNKNAIRMNINPTRGNEVFEIVMKIPQGAGGESIGATMPAAQSWMSVGDLMYGCVEVPAGQDTTSLRVTYASGPWKVVETLPAAGGPTIAMQSLMPNVDAGYTGMFETAKGVSLVLAFDSIVSGVNLRFVAVEKTGQSHTTSGSTAYGSRFALSLVEFPKLQLANVQNVRCEIRPRDAWVEFSGISLRQDQKTQPVVKSGEVALPAALTLFLARAADAPAQADIP